MEGNMETSLDKDITDTISTNLRHLRNNTKIIKNNKQKIMSQTEVAKFLGITYQQYSKYETRVDRINAINLYKISKFFGVDVNTMYDKHLELIAKIIKFSTTYYRAQMMTKPIDKTKLSYIFTHAKSEEDFIKDSKKEYIKFRKNLLNF